MVITRLMRHTTAIMMLPAQRERQDWMFAWGDERNAETIGDHWCTMVSGQTLWIKVSAGVLHLNTNTFHTFKLFGSTRLQGSLRECWVNVFKFDMQAVTLGISSRLQIAHLALQCPESHLWPLRGGWPP